MRAVYKFPISIGGATMIRTTSTAIFRHFGDQNGTLCAWLEVDTDAHQLNRHYQVFGTGHPVPRDAIYRGTALQGAFVWHLYEVFP